jgi:hypothetical protein
VTLLMTSLVNFEPEILYYGHYGIPHAFFLSLEGFISSDFTTSSLAIKVIFMLTFSF